MATRNADDKKGFCLFFDWVKDLDFLSGAEAWTVVKALCDYYENGVNPVDNVPNELKSIVSMMFHQIQRQEDIKAKRAEAGRNGGNTTAKNNFAKAKDSKTTAKLQQKPPTETDTITETDTYTKTNIRDKTACGVSSPPVSCFGEFRHIKLTDEQHSKLVSEYGESVIAECIDRMDSYLEQIGKPNKYKNFYAAIKNWIKKDNENKPNNAPLTPDDYTRGHEKEFLNYGL